jgi:hypothetical protein
MSEVRGIVPDFSGWWVLSKVENLDEFLRILGFPWVVRKASVKFGSCAVDIISQSETAVKITTLNCKGSWSRTYDTQQVIRQPDAEGVLCNTSSWWEGSVLHSKLEGSKLGTCFSSRYRRGDTLIVKTAVKNSQTDVEATCFWVFERMQALQEHLGGGTRSQLARALEADHRRVVRATRRDNSYLQKILMNWERWISPADEFIPLEGVGSANTQRKLHSAAGLRATARSPASPSNSSPQGGMSQNPSTNSLSTTVTTPQETRSDVGRNRHAAGRQPVAKPAPAFPPPDRGSDISPTDGKVRSKEEPKSARGTTLSDLSLPNSHQNLPQKHATSASQLSEPGTIRRNVHYRSPSAESGAISYGGGAFTPGSSPCQSTAPSAAEAVLVYKLHEYVESRGIASVVPVATPNDTTEPQLLEMSPEQAEETAAKLRELETDMLLQRQGAVNGCFCCGLVISLADDSLPDHLRVWEMSLT